MSHLKHFQKSGNGLTWLVHFLRDDLDTNIFRPEDTLTFDDGHYSIYKNIEIIKDLPCKKIIFITPNFIELGNRKEEPNFNIYWMDSFFIDHTRSHFLTLFELEELVSKYKFEIGGHSYYHDIVYRPRNLKNRSKFIINKNRRWYYHKLNDPNLFKLFTYCSALAEPGIDGLHRRTQQEFEEYVEQDTAMCQDWLTKYFGKSSKYAYPFFESSSYLEKMLEKYGFGEIYGERKEPIQEY